MGYMNTDKTEGRCRLQWLPVMDRAVVEQFGLHGRPDLFVLSLAVLFSVFALPPISRLTRVSPASLALLWLILAVWMLTIHRCCYSSALKNRGAFHLLVFGNVAAGTVVTLSVVVISRTPETPLWLGFCVMACVNGATESEPSILMGVVHLIAPFITIPIFLSQGADQPWAIVGPTACSLISAYGYQFLSRRGQRWRLERHENEIAAARLRFEASERERRRLARELHDTVGAALSQLVLYCAKLQYNSNPAIPQHAASTMQDIARTGLHELRGFLDALPQAPTTLGELREGMLIVAGRAAGLAGAKLRLEIQGQVESIVSGEIRTTLVRIFHETVLNAIRHGAAKRIEATLEVEGDVLKMITTDDGTGFALSTPNGGFGLIAMKERAQALGGELQVLSTPGHGTTIHLTLPLSSTEPAQ